MKAPNIDTPYIHEKGGIYYPLFMALNKETEEMSVVYKKHGKDGRLYTRSLKDWNEKFSSVERDTSITREEGAQILKKDFEDLRSDKNKEIAEKVEELLFEF